MKNCTLILMGILISILFLPNCSGGSGKGSNALSISNAITTDGYQQRRDGLFYLRNTQDVITGTLNKEGFMQHRMFEGHEGIYWNLWFVVKEGVLNGKCVEYRRYTEGLAAWIGGPVEEPAIFQELTYKDGFVSGKVMLYSHDGDVLVEGQVNEGKKVGEWLVFDGNNMITIPISNDNYSLPEGVELESSIDEFLKRKWNKGMNEFY